METVMLQARPDVRPTITDNVVATINRVGDEAGLGSEINALVNYIQHMFHMRNVLKQRKQWDEDRQAKIVAAIAAAMKH